MCDIAGRTTKRAVRNFPQHSGRCCLLVACAAQPLEHLQRVCRLHAVRASPTMTIIFAEIERISSSLMFWSLMFGLHLLEVGVERRGIRKVLLECLLDESTGECFGAEASDGLEH